MIPPLGVAGAALGTVISQGVYCLILFTLFIHHKDSATFQIQKWQFSTSRFLELIRLGAPSAISRSLSLFYWVLVVKMVSNLEGEFLLVLSYGQTLWFPISAVSEALGKGLISLFFF